MSLLRSCAVDIVDVHDVTSLAASHDISLGLAALNVVDSHGVADELGRSCWSDLDLRQIVIWVQRIISLSRGLELDNLGSGSMNIIGRQVCLVLVQTHMEGTWSRAVDVPVLVGEFLLVGLLRAMKLGDSTYFRYKEVIDLLSESVLRSIHCNCFGSNGHRALDS